METSRREKKHKLYRKKKEKWWEILVPSLALQNLAFDT